MNSGPRPLSDDRYLIIYRQPSHAAAGSAVPLSLRDFRGGYRIVDVDLPGFGDCAMPGAEEPLAFPARAAAEAFLQRCYKAWGLRPRRGEAVPSLA